MAQLQVDDSLENYRYADNQNKLARFNFSANFTQSLIAPPITTPAPDKITGNFASDNIFAAWSIASAPPACLSNLTIGKFNIYNLSPKSLGTLICAGAEPLIAFSITLFSTSAILDGSLTSSLVTNHIFK